MDIGSLLIIFAVLLLVGFYISQPIMERKSTSTISQDEIELSSLLAERDRTLNAIQELEFDYALGKIPEEDYPLQRSRMLSYGAEILRKLDELQPQADNQLESFISERQKSASTVQSVSSSTAADDPLEVKIAERRRQRNTKAAGFCHQCGNPLQLSDTFCPRCGNKTN